MTKTLKVDYELPAVLPSGWKGSVAVALGIHRNTVTNALNAGSGETYERIIQCAKIKYGKPIQITYR